MDNRNEEEYTFQIGENDFENSLRIFNGGEEIYFIDGEQYNIDIKNIPFGELPSVAESCVRDIIHKATDSLPMIQPGQYIKMYQYHPGEELYLVSGNVHAINQEMLHITLEDGSSCIFLEKELYTQEQGAVLDKAIKDELPASCLIILCDHNLSVTHMELYRYGLKYGISKYELDKVIEGNIPYIEKQKLISAAIRNNRIKMAKQIKEAGYDADLNMIRRLEALNLKKGKMHTLNDIAQIFTMKSYQYDWPKLQNEIDIMAREFAQQDRERQNKRTGQKSIVDN